MPGYFDRYKQFRLDGDMIKVPNIKIPTFDTDLYILYDKDKHRLDSLSYKYFGDPDYGWLLMMANPHLGSMEFEIPNASQFRIPYPLDSALQRYNLEVKKALKKQ